MKLETILNAFEKTAQEVAWWGYREIRQYRTFRTRILKMDADKDEAYKRLDKAFDNYIELKDADFLEMYTDALDKDKRIAKLEDLVQWDQDD